MTHVPSLARRRMTSDAGAAPKRLEACARGGFRLLERLCEPAATALATRLFLTPRRHPRRPEERSLLDGAHAFGVELAGAHLRCWSWGQGPVALLAHGWEGRGGQLGAFVEPLVAAGYRVVAFDQVAHGDSTGQRSSLPEFRSGLLAVVRAVGFPDVVVAHSLGSVAAALALEEGLPIRRLVFLAPPADLHEYADRALDRLGASQLVRNTLRWRLEARFRFPMHRASVRTIAGSMTTPLLVVHDREDREVPFRDGERIARAWPGAGLHATSGLGHRRLLRDPGVIRRAVDFLGTPHGNAVFGATGPGA